MDEDLKRVAEAAAELALSLLSRLLEVEAEKRELVEALTRLSDAVDQLAPNAINRALLDALLDARALQAKEPT
jgi:hypothetical protein